MSSNSVTSRGRIAAVIATFLSALLIVVGISTPANAAMPAGFSVSTGVVDGQVVTGDGSTLHRLQLSYPPNVSAGEKIIISLPDGVEIPTVPPVPSGNDAITSIVRLDNGDFEVTFSDNAKNNQGILGFDYVFTAPVDGSTISNVEWNVNGDVIKNSITIMEKGDVSRPRHYELRSQECA